MITSGFRKGLAGGIARRPLAQVLVIATIGAGAWYVLSRALTLPQVFSDELVYFEAARAFAEHGAVPTYYGVVVPALDSVAFLVASGPVAAYHVIQLINNVAMASAAFPAYLLARRALPHSWALVVAALTVSVPWMVYARFVMTEPVFYPVFLWFVLALARALELPTRRRQLVLLLVAALAYATRAQAAVLFPAIVVAVLLFGVARGTARTLVQSFTFTWILSCIGGAAVLGAAAVSSWNPFGAYSGLLQGLRHPHGLLLWTAANVTSLSLGVGILVAAAAPLGAITLLRREGTTAGQAFAAAAVSSTLGLLLTVVVLSENALYGLGSVHERNLFYVVPLLLICALAWAERGFPASRRLLGVTGAGVIALAWLMPAGVLEGGSFDTLSFKFWTQLTPAGLTPHVVIVLAVVVAAILLVVARSTALLVATFVLATVGVASASNYHNDVPRSLTARYEWVDRALPAHANATLLWVDCSAPACGTGHPSSGLAKMAVYTELFNSHVSKVGRIGADNPERGLASTVFTLRRDGTVLRDSLPFHSRYVVVDSRVQVSGTRIAVLKPAAVGGEAATNRDALVLWRTNDRYVHLTRR
jgi:hypothetical protein